MNDPSMREFSDLDNDRPVVDIPDVWDCKEQILSSMANHLNNSNVKMVGGRIMCGDDDVTGKTTHALEVSAKQFGTCTAQVVTSPTKRRSAVIDSQHQLHWIHVELAKDKVYEPIGGIINVGECSWIYHIREHN